MRAKKIQLTSFCVKIDAYGTCFSLSLELCGWVQSRSGTPFWVGRAFVFEKKHKKVWKVGPLCVLWWFGRWEKGLFSRMIHLLYYERKSWFNFSPLVNDQVYYKGLFIIYKCFIDWVGCKWAGVGFVRPILSFVQLWLVVFLVVALGFFFSGLLFINFFYP